MPANGDDKTEVEAGAAPQAPQTQNPSPAEERTEFQPDTDCVVPPKPPPAEDGTVLQPPPAPPPASDGTERSPAAVSPAPKPVRAAGEDLTESQEIPTLPPTTPRERHVPGYRLIQPLGGGTYGEVWLAEDERTGIRVAVKFLSHGTGLEWQLIQAEVKQLALLHADPGIVQLLDVELEADPPYYLMAYAEHGSLARRLEKGPLPLAEALEIFRQLAEALAYVHAKGVRHCDLKPGNILLNARNRILIADFGQAHFSSEAAPALGTFFYMAPEQADLSRQIPDTRWDVYALGAIVHAMLTGQPPREDAAARADLAATTDLGQRLARYRAWVQKAPRPDRHRRAPGIDRRLVEIIDRCLEVDPARRLHDAGAVLAALARRERQRRQRPLLVFGFVAQVVLFLVLGGVAVWAGSDGIRSSEAALVKQMLASERVTASLVASGLEQELLARKQLLEKFAAMPALRAATRKKHRAELDRLIKQFNEVQAPEVLSWAVTDAKGELLAYKLNTELPRGAQVEGNYAWRDWFNGTGDKPQRIGEHFPPITKTHFSQPFRRRFAAEMAIGVSTPVFDPQDPKQLVGVLYTPVRLADIQRWLDQVTIQDGFAVLIDDRGHCLRHKEAARILPKADHEPPTYQSRTFAEALRQAGSNAEHHDPIDGRVYLASYAPLPKIGWGALVQHERAAALRPIDDLKTRLLYLGLVLLLGVPLLVSGLWAWLIWTLRRKERVAQN